MTAAYRIRCAAHAPAGDTAPSGPGQVLPPTDPAPAEARITLEERQLLILIAEGQPMTALAQKTYTSSIRTLRRQTRALCDKLGVQSIIEAVAWAARRGLI